MNHDRQEYPLLIARKGPLQGERWYLDKPLLIGRGSDCNIVIPDRQVSRYHARVRMRGEHVELEDLGSKNGTFHNGDVVETPIILQDGDTVQIALAQEFVFLVSDATMPINREMMRPHRLVMDERSRMVWVNRVQLDPPLSANQFNLLWTLYQRDGEVVSRADLVRAVWGGDAYGISEQALDALVRRIRDRLAEADPLHSYLVTVRGHGLRLDNPRA